MEHVFTKYSKIENAHNGKFINKIADVFPEEVKGKCKWQATEKLDGANFQISITIDDKGTNVQYGKRTSYLNEQDGNFFDYQTVMEDDRIKQLINETILKFELSMGDIQVDIFGELFGPGIQKRLNYGDVKQFRIFDIRVNGSWRTQEEVKTFLDDAGVIELYVPEFGIFDTLDEALLFNIKDVPTAIGDSGDEIEGVVIKPYDVVLSMPNKNRVIIKNKNESFADKAHRNKKVKTPTKATEEQNEFMTYITKNRLLDLISKEGTYTQKEIGKMLPKFFNDAWEDFTNANPDLAEIDKKEKKKFSGFVTKAMVKLIQEEAEYE
jgi:Rnl2 family RNA ligase